MTKDFRTATIIAIYLLVTLWFALTALGCKSPTKDDVWTEDTCNQPAMKCYGSCGERNEVVECVCEYKREKGCL